MAAEQNDIFLIFDTIIDTIHRLSFCRIDPLNARNHSPDRTNFFFQPYVRGIPDYDYEIGTLRFIRNSRPVNSREDTPEEPFQAFKGEGFTLRTAKSKN